MVLQLCVRRVRYFLFIAACHPSRSLLRATRRVPFLPKQPMHAQKNEFLVDAIPFINHLSPGLIFMLRDLYTLLPFDTVTSPSLLSEPVQISNFRVAPYPSPLSFFITFILPSLAFLTPFTPHFLHTCSVLCFLLRNLRLIQLTFSSHLCTTVSFLLHSINYSVYFFLALLTFLCYLCVSL
jgi:hypothetical protein